MTQARVSNRASFEAVNRAGRSTQHRKGPSSEAVNRAGRSTQHQKEPPFEAVNRAGRSIQHRKGPSSEAVNRAGRSIQHRKGPPFEAAFSAELWESPISAVLAALIVAIVFLSLSACSAKPPKPVQARAQLVVSGDANPDTSGRASPIVVRLFQLRNDGEFAAADFWALYEKEKETLGASLISREEYVLAPGETRTLELGLNPEARFIGAVAAYRDIRAAHWRALTRAPEKKLTDLIGKDGVTVSVGKDTVTLAVKD